MGVIESASGASVWRGYDYYKQGKVSNILKSDDGRIFATVSGSSDAHYTVELDIEHPKRSKCNCPHADGRRIVCKHSVSTYFTLFPEEAERFYTEAMKRQEEEERREEELADKVSEYIYKMKKSELQQALLDLLFSGPEWQYENFLSEYGLDEDC